MLKHVYKYNRSKECHKDVKKYTQIDHLRSQISKEHAYAKLSKWVKCEQCTYRTTCTPHLHKLKTHMPLLTAELQCRYCTYKTKLKDSMKRHVNRMHTDPNDTTSWNKCVIEVCMDKWIECTKCSFKCKRKGDMKRHKEKYPLHQFFCHSTSLRTYKCDSCDFTTDLKVTLTNHVKTTHKQKRIDLERTFLERFGCKECNFRTFSMLVWIKHSRSCNERKEESESFYQCEKCPSYYKRKGQLMDHVWRKHGDLKYNERLAGVIPLHQCGHCTFPTNIINSLNNHMKRHSVRY